MNLCQARFAYVGIQVIILANEHSWQMYKKSNNENLKELQW
jgi:hypothetical protein